MELLEEQFRNDPDFRATVVDWEERLDLDARGEVIIQALLDDLLEEFD